MLLNRRQIILGSSSVMLTPLGIPDGNPFVEPPYTLLEVPPEIKALCWFQWPELIVPEILGHLRPTTKLISDLVPGKYPATITFNDDCEAFADFQWFYTGFGLKNCLNRSREEILTNFLRPSAITLANALNYLSPNADSITTRIPSSDQIKQPHTGIAGYSSKGLSIGVTLTHLAGNENDWFASVDLLAAFRWKMHRDWVPDPRFVPEAPREQSQMLVPPPFNSFIDYRS